MKIRAFKDRIIAVDGDLGDQVTESGLLIKSNVDQADGITPRWFRVFEVGPEIDWLKANDWILVEYGRWTPAVELDDDRLEDTTEAWRIDPEGCLAVSEEKPDTIYFNTETVTASKMTR
jgi:hypothetical protein